MNVISKIKKMEIKILTQKRIIDRLSRKIQKLRTEIKRLERIKPNSVVISSDGMKFYIGNEVLNQILVNQNILNLNTNSINQKITFHGRTYIIRNLILKQQIGCIDELQIIAHEISEELVKKDGESNESKRY